MSLFRNTKKDIESKNTSVISTSVNQTPVYKTANTMGVRKTHVYYNKIQTPLTASKHSFEEAEGKHDFEKAEGLMEWLTAALSLIGSAAAAGGGTEDTRQLFVEPEGLPLIDYIKYTTDVAGRTFYVDEQRDIDILRDTLTMNGQDEKTVSAAVEAVQAEFNKLPKNQRGKDLQEEQKVELPDYSSLITTSPFPMPLPPAADLPPATNLPSTTPAKKKFNLNIVPKKTSKNTSKKTRPVPPAAPKKKELPFNPTPPSDTKNDDKLTEINSTSGQDNSTSGPAGATVKTSGPADAIDSDQAERLSARLYAGKKPQDKDKGEGKKTGKTSVPGNPATEPYLTPTVGAAVGVSAVIGGVAYYAYGEKKLITTRKLKIANVMKLVQSIPAGYGITQKEKSFLLERISKFQKYYNNLPFNDDTMSVVRRAAMSRLRALSKEIRHFLAFEARHIRQWQKMEISALNLAEKTIREAGEDGAGFEGDEWQKLREEFLKAQEQGQEDISSRLEHWDEKLRPVMDEHDELEKEIKILNKEFQKAHTGFKSIDKRTKLPEEEKRREAFRKELREKYAAIEDKLKKLPLADEKRLKKEIQLPQRRR
tara:strand:+ start:3738 stop:5519 length:1782 start_codon:yes stop_codon:yes gene_type:complete